MRSRFGPDYIGKPISMEDIYSMVAKMTANAEDLLWDSLMFRESEDIWFGISLASIKEVLT